MTEVIDNPDAARFELTEGGETAVAHYRLTDGKLYIDYVEAPPALRGKGTAGRLMAGVMAAAGQRRLEVVPICGYAAAWIRRHPDQAD